MSGGKLDRFCAFRGLGAVPIQLGTSSRGGMFQECGVCLFHTPFCYLAAGQSLGSGGPASE